MYKGLMYSTTSERQNSPVVVYKYNGKRKLGPRESYYHNAINRCRELFPEISLCSSISFHTNDLDICGGEMAEIPQMAWADAAEILKSVTVMVDVEPGSKPPSSEAEVVSPIRRDGQHLIQFITPDRKVIFIGIDGDTTFGRIKRGVVAIMGLEDAGGFDFMYNELELNDNDTPRSVNMDFESRVNIIAELMFRKPVIYLFSPTPLEAWVKLSLVPKWDLSVIYPEVPIKARSNTNPNQEVTWRVKVLPNGDLRELTTGLDVTYLFWEALTNSNMLVSPPPTPTIEKSEQEMTEIFDPTCAVLDDDNSVVLAVDKITPYLDKALQALELHTEARTSFITFWLPAFLKHQNVALRFVPQAAYSQAAPLDISPAPDVITRIFMIFRGVKDNELDEWTRARASVNKNVSFWQEVVGVDVQKALDTTLFRVLEWGGMEVVRAL